MTAGMSTSFRRPGRLSALLANSSSSPRSRMIATLAPRAPAAGSAPVHATARRPHHAPAARTWRRRGRSRSRGRGAAPRLRSCSPEEPALLLRLLLDPLHRVDDHHGPARAVRDAVRDVPEQELLAAAHTDVPDHDHVDILALRRLDDRLPRVVAHDD